MGANLHHLVLFHKFQSVADGLVIQGNLIIGLCVHEVIQIPVRVQILHIHPINSCLGEFLCGTEGFLNHAAADDIFQFCSDKSGSLSGFYVLELDNLVNASFHLQRNAVSKITC